MRPSPAHLAARCSAASLRPSRSRTCPAGTFWKVWTRPEGQVTVIPRHVARHAQITQPTGVRIMRTLSNSPAETAGLQAGDLVITIDGVPVLGIDDLLRVLDHERIGRSVPVVALRRGERLETAVVPVERR